jgi:mannose-1-phosphate guanylyltransferase
MKALFLAGGMGTRLRPLTDNLPKPMVPIMNQPLLERTFMKLKKCGITEIMISTCYHPEYIKNYFGDGSNLNMKIRYTIEETPMGTGGAVKMAEKYLKESFLVFNSDILTDIDFSKMIAFHKSKKAMATIAVTEVKNTSIYGVIDYDESGYASAFIEKPKPGESDSKSINAGIYIFEPEIFKEISGNRPVSIEHEIFPKLLRQNHKIAVYQSNCYWMDIGTIEKYRQAHWDIMNGKCKLVEGEFNKNKVSFGTKVSLGLDAKIIGPAFIGDNVILGAGVLINHSVIGKGVTVGENSKINGSIIWNNVVISKGAVLNDAVVTESSGENSEDTLLKTITIMKPLNPASVAAQKKNK